MKEILESAGIHHVTAIAGDPQDNLDFYTAFLGLRLVKITVNFDAPGRYHLYYGDGQGRPGSLLTFFPWPEARQGHKGSGQASIVSFAILPGAIPYWMDRLTQFGLLYEGPISRRDDAVLTFFDRDDLQVELVACAQAGEREPWTNGPVPAEHAVRGLYGITVIENDPAATEEFLVETLGFRSAGSSANHRSRYVVGSGRDIAYVDVLALPGMARGRMGRGAIHHVAWRTGDARAQAAWRHRLIEQGQQVTAILDRKYFQSIYFREPGGVLFEIATDGPGFTVDEPLADLGSELQLPASLATRRAELAAALPPLRLPGGMTLEPIWLLERHDVENR